jgi:hypothetical protein
MALSLDESIVGKRDPRRMKAYAPGEQETGGGEAVGLSQGDYHRNGGWLAGGSNHHFMDHVASYL